MKKLLLALPLVAASLSLSACAPAAPTAAPVTSANPQQVKLLWFNTQAGAVKCLTYQLPIPSGRSSTLLPFHDCDWSTLKSGAVAGAEVIARTSWVKVDGKEFFCLTESSRSYSSTYYDGYPSYNCDWTHPRDAAQTSS